MAEKMKWKKIVGKATVQKELDPVRYPSIQFCTEPYDTQGFKTKKSQGVI